MTPLDHALLLIESATPGACILWDRGRTAAGYPTARRDGKTVYVHALACEHLHGPRPDGLQAAHRCGIPSCVNPHHLRWATRRENLADRIAHGTHRRGERFTLAKLTNDQARTILAIGRSRPGVEVAAEFGVSPQTIYDIRARRRWAWLDEDAA